MLRRKNVEQDLQPSQLIVDHLPCYPGFDWIVMTPFSYFSVIVPVYNDSDD